MPAAPGDGRAIGEPSQARAAP